MKFDLKIRSPFCIASKCSLELYKFKHQKKKKTENYRVGVLSADPAMTVSKLLPKGSLK